MNQNNKFKGIFIYLAVIVLLVIGMVTMLQMSATPGEHTTYSKVISEFDNYNVSGYTLDLGSGELQYTLKSDNTKKYKYSVPNVSLFLQDTQGYRKAYNEKNPDSQLVEDFYPVSDNSFLLSFLPYLLMVALMIGFTFVIMRQASGGGKMSQFSKANARTQPSNGPKITFADVAGAEEEKEEMSEIVDFMKNPRKYQELGAKIPRGVLLLGPPGTGKTLLAKAVAGEANVPFFSISGSDFVEMFVGVGASRVRDLFDQAKKHTPSIIFIDEIDAVGRQRGTGLGGGHDEREQTLNQLLVEMDGFTDNQGVIVIAATNRRDILDPALLRPGRFDRQITVGYPDIKGREAILRVHTKNKKLAPDISLATIAKGTAGFTGADLANLVNEAALLAARNNRKAITQPDIEEATIKVVAGPEKKSKVVSEDEKRLTAFHEAGHAVCTFHCKTQDPVHQVSIIPRGMAGGYTMSLPEHDRSFRTKTQMEEEVIVLLGGRVAEKIVLDEISTGASNDIERATDLARSMITRYGFSEKLGPIVYGHDNSEVFLGRDYSQGRNYSENVAAEIDGEIRELIDTSYENAKQILLSHRDQLDKVAHYLMEHEKIDGEDFYKLMNGEPLDDNTAAPVSENSDTVPADCEDTAEATGDNNNETNE
ncbi:MAG: ATP-dependent zinc metalloprotease FtsH [[Eubacterium] siraeum]|jgi:ATP-dependent metallopeptidase hflB|uniref:ATP-dependent zinc metalloprotease FtsH n=1 Tax=[Eubacterium] siraeum 70/3 TaxID=657319 RepID=D4JS40_9FIRM|nr:ATP-dependent zinc metalloprotease FtsH [[Eubacterium] siraeum]CBK95909.1 membrane protease FtsH catalytic subunit [[Eubacterium] siraeum 70/3]